MTPKENLLRAIRHDHPQWVPATGEAVVQIRPPIVERPAGEGLDSFGVHWSFEADAEGGTFPTHGREPLKDLSRWHEQITIPDVDRFDWSAVRHEAGRIDREQALVQGFVEMGLFERMYLLMGMEAALIACMEQPEQMAQLAAAIADYKIRFLTRFHEEVCLDLVWYGDDWGTQASEFLPPATWRRIIKPHTQRIYEAARQLGIMVNQHSCGKIEEIFDDIVQMGATIWNPCQPCNDLAALKRRYAGRITFCGGIDSQFVLHRPGVTVSEVRTEVRRRIDEMAAGGGYIAGPSHGVPYDPAIVQAMQEEIATYGRHIYA